MPQRSFILCFYAKEKHKRDIFVRFDYNTSPAHIMCTEMGNMCYSPWKEYKEKSTTEQNGMSHTIGAQIQSPWFQYNIYSFLNIH